MTNKKLLTRNDVRNAAQGIITFLDEEGIYSIKDLRSLGGVDFPVNTNHYIQVRRIRLGPLSYSAKLSYRTEDSQSVIKARMGESANGGFMMFKCGEVIPGYHIAVKREKDNILHEQFFSSLTPRSLRSVMADLVDKLG